MEGILTLLLVLVGIAAGGAVGYYLRKQHTEAEAQVSAERSKEVLASARKEAENLRREAENIRKEAELQAKDYVFKAKSDFEKEAREQKREQQVIEKRLLQKEENIDKKTDQLDRREAEISQKQKELSGRESEIGLKEKDVTKLVQDARAKLEALAGISAEDAKRQLIEGLVEEAKHESAKRVRAIEEEAKETAERKAKNIIVQSIQRYAGDYVTERTVTVVPLPNDEMKGRIIGREGRNIRAIEAATGVDLIIDDTPEAVSIYAHNPIRREVARITLEQLIADGRIHPSRIEEIVAKVSQEVEVSVKEAGEAALFDLGIHGMHPELIKLLGTLKHRTSLTQNLLQHSIESAFFCGIMAAELKLNVKTARRAALLHDIGKAIDHEQEGSHAIIGGDVARKYGETPEIVHAIAAHHEDIAQEGLLPVLVQAADAISAARPGARRDMAAAYIKRLEDLEKLANSFQGVERSYAVQAGRELRVIVENGKISEEAAFLLARDIAKKIESEMTYPGQIKVTVIRETRAVEYAR